MAITNNYDGEYFDEYCPICGYTKCTEEKIPSDCDTVLAKEKQKMMSEEEKERAIELFYEDGKSLIDRFNKD